MTPAGTVAVSMATILSPRTRRVELEGSARGAEMGYRVTDWGHGGGVQGDAGARLQEAMSYMVKASSRFPDTLDLDQEESVNEISG